MYCLAGFRHAGRDQTDWEPDETHDDIDEAVAAAEGWIVGNPSGRVDVVEVKAGQWSAVRAVTRSGVERIEAVEAPRTSRIAGWSARHPLVVFVAGTAVGVWMFLDPSSSRRYSSGETRVMGGLAAVLFGGLTLAVLLRRLRARRSAE